MRILGFDSGMDLVAGVLVDTTLCPGALPRDFNGLARAAHGFVEEVRVTTPPTLSTVARCQMIRDGLRERAPRGVDVVLIEVPRIDGRYRRHSGLGENELVTDLSKLNRSIGAISCGVEGLLVLEVPAAAGSKDARRVEINTAMAAAGKPLIRNGDVVDAAHMTFTAAAEFLRNSRYFGQCAYAGKLYPSAAAATAARLEVEERAKPRARRPA
ncbi:MAG: hypothetical protein AB1941_10090 [Gemmatimonadota bacterium]